jgi:hypothetical protein
MMSRPFPTVEVNSQFHSGVKSLATIGQLCGQTFEDEDEYGLTDLVRMALRTLNGAALASRREQSPVGFKPYQCPSLADLESD